MSRHVLRLAVAGVLAGGILAGGASAATAAPVLEQGVAVSAAAACAAHPVRPVKVGSTIRGATTFSRCSGRATLTVQRKRWWGWENVKSAGVPASGRRTLAASCRGSGTFTYRTLVTGRVAGNPKAWSSATYRVRC
ncbi:hypothetical protein Acy02nite_35380 [Actinoplanes cyaneus]|uniref:Secreted protein n=1 Tax=Actinoplanes cyaneus TaxID=52696 RepID=A0A919IJS4_9ACTN|nr:hypothetical protein [Actinoplanes cyaneus]MCW2140339.1 hypothetical protein [Actinoplanes cyaneus]GID65657.1 hypothetical protein Acy02nite_35380 [Actinoplanes cyaneus]